MARQIDSAKLKFTQAPPEYITTDMDKLRELAHLSPEVLEALDATRPIMPCREDLCEDHCWHNVIIPRPDHIHDYSRDVCCHCGVYKDGEVTYFTLLITFPDETKHGPFAQKEE